MIYVLKTKEEEKGSYWADEIEFLGKQKEEAISNGKYVDPTFFGGQVEKGGDKCRKKLEMGLEI